MFELIQPLAFNSPAHPDDVSHVKSSLPIWMDKKQSRVLDLNLPSKHVKFLDQED